MDRNEVNVNLAIGNPTAECERREAVIPSILLYTRHRKIGPFVSSCGFRFHPCSLNVTGAVCLVRTSYGQTTSPFHIGVVLLECCVGDVLKAPENRLDFDLLDLDFFDDETIVVVLRLRTEDGKREIRCRAGR